MAGYVSALMNRRSSILSCLMWPCLGVMSRARETWAATASPAPAPPPKPELAGWTVTMAVVDGSLSGSIVRVVPETGGVLAAHVARLFMWDLDLRRDVVKGDRVTVVWRDGSAGQPEIGAAAYRSIARGRTLRAYQFRASGDDHASYWDDQGQEVPKRLQGGPLRQYEQITALLKDRPTHQGMDFKTPVGTPIVSPRAGTVTRVDWKPRGNGRCVEVRYDDGVLAKFLHLSSAKVGAGARVRTGDVIALTGNTGHSTAPHLHYQLARGGQTLDPVDYHGTSRRKLEPASARAFQKIVAQFAPALRD